MPFLTQEMIDSLKQPDGSFSRHALYLLGAIPKPRNNVLPHDVQCPLMRVQPPEDWPARALMNRITARQVMAIKAAARELKKGFGNSDRENPRQLRSCSAPRPKGIGVPMKYLRRLRRKLLTAHEHEIKIIDEIIQEAQKAIKAQAA